MRFDRKGRWVLLATAVAQALSPAVAGFDQGRSEDPVVVPPGPFFAVWGVVVLGCLAVAVRGLPAHRAARAAFRRLHVPLAIAQCGFVLWLLFASTEPVLTVPVFALMLAMLVVALRRAPETGDGGQAEGLVLTEAVLGVYAGWSAAAVWINIATVLDRPATPLLAALLVGAVVSEVVLVAVVCRTLAARTAASAAGLWALSGVALSASTASASSLVILAVAGCAAVVVAAFVRARRPGHGRPAAAGPASRHC